MLVKVVAEILLAEIRGLDNVVARYYYDTIQRRLSILTLLILLLLPCQSAHLNLHYFPLLSMLLFLPFTPVHVGTYHQKGR